MHRLPIALLLLLLLAAQPATTQGTTQDDELLESWVLDKFTWEGTLAGERPVLEVRNVHGDIRTRIAEGDAVFVSAVLQHHQDDPLVAEIAVEPGDDGRLLVEVRYAPREGAVASPAEGVGFERRRVDLTVLVPPGARLEAHTDGGLIEAKGLESDVLARSLRGDVTVAVTGDVDAQTDRGAIVATFKSTDWNRGPRLETLTGDITAWLPPDARGRIEAQTHGVISTDFSISIEHREPHDRKYARALLGEGGKTLTVRSERGSLSFFRSRF